jgi:hypothetical protein
VNNPPAGKHSKQFNHQNLWHVSREFPTYARICNGIAYFMPDNLFTLFPIFARKLLILGSGDFHIMPDLTVNL